MAEKQAAKANPGGTPQKKQPKPERKDPERKDRDINTAQDWADMRAQWARERRDMIQAHADRFFMTDDELPLHQHVLLAVVVAFFVVFVIWANLARIDEVTHGQGRVVPSSEVQVLQSLEGGIVDAIMVREGDEVTAGQPLLRLRDVQASSDLGTNRKRYLGLLAKAQRLKAEAEGKPSPEFSEEVMNGVPQSVQDEMNAFRATLQNQATQAQVLEQQYAQREQEVSALKTRVGDLTSVLNMSRQERDMVAPLVEKGSAPKMELLQLERAIKEKMTELNSTSGSLRQAQSAVQEAQARLNELKSAAMAQAQTELAATTIEMNAIKETLAGLEDKKTRTEIKSPVNGFIKDIKISTIGGVVQPAADIVEIVPKDDQLIVEAQVRPSDIAFLHPDQKAMVKITAYDFSIYGGLKGELVDISADTITNEKGEMFYRVRVRTNETSLKRKGEVLPIIPGMVATVDIMTGKKTVMQYIMKPLIKTVNDAMRER